MIVFYKFKGQTYLTGTGNRLAMRNPVPEAWVGAYLMLLIGLFTSWQTAQFFTELEQTELGRSFSRTAQFLICIIFIFIIPIIIISNAIYYFITYLYYAYYLWQLWLTETDK